MSTTQCGRTSSGEEAITSEVQKDGKPTAAKSSNDPLLHNPKTKGTLRSVMSAYDHKQCPH